MKRNIKADHLANDGRYVEPEEISVPGEDAIRNVKQLIRQHWDYVWHSIRDVKLREVKMTTNNWTDSAKPEDQRTLTRLRIGHTRLTHTHLLKREPPVVCECCGVSLTVKHIILECRKHEEARQKYNINTTSLRMTLINDTEVEQKLLDYLRESGLYHKI